MPRYTYLARDRFGAAQTGVVEEASPQSAVEYLRRRQWLVINVRPEAAKQAGPGLWTMLRPASWLPVGMADIELSLRQLAVMSRSGLTLLEALRLLTEHAVRQSMRRAWRRVADGILAGGSMAASMTACRCFPPVVVQLARVGEQTGELDQALRRAADILEHHRRLRSQILSAMAYPTLVFISAISVAAFLVFHVIPKLQRFLQVMNKSLPPMTQLLIDITEGAHRYMWHGLAAIVGLVLLATVPRYWPRGRRWSDRCLLWIPVIGNALRVAATAALARNLQTLLQSGVSLLDALQSVEQMLGNRYLASELALARDEVVQGRSLAEALQLHGSFSVLLNRMAAIGESAGRLEEVLGEAAAYYEDSLERTIRKLAALVEPVMLLVVGGIVGFVYIAFFMALFAAAR